GDIYLKAGRFRKAASDYARALHAYPRYEMDRWKPIFRRAGEEYSIDTRTLDLSPDNTVSLWVKVQGTKSENYDQAKYEIDCSGQRIKAASYIRYDPRGNALRSRSENDWQNVVPDTVGEVLYSGMCR